MNRQGFTLIELLLAVTLSALMVGIVMGTYLGIRRGVRENLVKHEAELEGGLIIRRMGWDLTSAYMGNPWIPERFYFKGETSGRPWQTTRLSFAGVVTGGSAKEWSGDRDLVRITYRLVPSKKREGFYLLFRDLAPLEGQKPISVEPMSDRVTSLRILYEDKNSRFYKHWDSRTDPWRDHLPTLVRIELSVWDARGKYHTFHLSVHPVQDWMN